MLPCMLYPNRKESIRSSAPDPFTGPGEFEREVNWLPLTIGRSSFAPSTSGAIEGDGGLLDAEDWSLPELL